MNFTIFLFYFLTIAIWGSSWLAIKFQFGIVPSEVSVTYRFMISAFILLIYCFCTKRKLHFSFKDHIFMALQGLFLFGLNYQLIYISSTYLTSGLVAVAFSTITVMNILNTALFLKHKMDKKVIGATFIGLVGLICIFYPEIAQTHLSKQTIMGLGIALLATLSASFGNIIAVRHKKANIGVIESNTVGMVYGSFFSFVFVILAGIPFKFDPSFHYVASMIYLSLFATVIAFGAYLSLVGLIGADKASYTVLIFPIVALALSTFFEDYHWSFMAILGIVLVLFGNAIILKLQQKAKAEIVTN
ncbi:MAG: DMT family transporter [Alphaproteobacteria bacterium]|nr:DMT family transporter [Alphaproteobacteria bacterium]